MSSTPSQPQGTERPDGGGMPQSARNADVAGSAVAATLVLGGPASGKTALLEMRAEELAAEELAAAKESAGAEERAAADKESPEGRGVLFVCASPQTAETAREQLPNGVTVADARSLAESLLEGADRTRLLQPYEEQFLFEDLRTCGLPQKQIRKVLEFIYANMASCGDWNPGWIEMHEERLVYDALMGALAFTGGTVEPELANRAAKLLEDNPLLREQRGFDHVLVDDYGLLNRNSQLLCNLLARKSITVAGEPGFSLVVHDSHPNPAGLDEFSALHPSAKTIELDVSGLANGAPDEPTGEGSALGARSNEAGTLPDAAAPGTRPREEFTVAPTLKDEFDAIVARVKKAIAGGTPPDRIAVMGANRTWTRNMARYLEDWAGLPVRQPARRIRIRDFRDEKGCSAAYADTLARLADDPADGVALRSLFGFGDYLARSVEVKRFRETHPNAHMVDLVTAPAPEELQRMLKRTDRGQDSRTDEPRNGGGIWVGHPRELFGRTFDLVIFGGLVPGWIPATGFADAVGAKREHMMEDAALTVECARRAAGGALAFSSFAECDLEFAERLGLNYKRSRLRNGVRTCELSPTFEALPELFGAS